MAYFFAIAVIILLFAVLHFFTELGIKEKMVIGAGLLAVVLFAIAYNSYNASERDKMMKSELKFNQNKTLTCNDIKVDNTTFSFSIGTHTFIGKKGSENAGMMIDVRQCQ